MALRRLPLVALSTLALALLASPALARTGSPPPPDRDPRLAVATPPYPVLDPFPTLTSAASVTLSGTTSTTRAMEINTPLGVLHRSTGS